MQQGKGGPDQGRWQDSVHSTRPEEENLLWKIINDGKAEGAQLCLKASPPGPARRKEERVGLLFAGL